MLEFEASYLPLDSLFNNFAPDMAIYDKNHCMPARAGIRILSSRVDNIAHQ